MKSTPKLPVLIEFNYTVVQKKAFLRDATLSKMAEPELAGNKGHGIGMGRYWTRIQPWGFFFVRLPS